MCIRDRHFSCDQLENFSLQTIIFPEVGGSLNIYGGIFSEGEEVMLVATPNEFFEFISWSGSEVGTDSTLTFVESPYASFLLQKSHH